MTFAEQVNIERKSYFLIRAKDVRLPTRHAIIFLVCCDRERVLNLMTLGVYSNRNRADIL